MPHRRLPARVVPFLLSALALLAAGGDLQAGAQPATQPNPAAPAQTAEFDFLIGSWDCSTRSMRPDGTLSPPGRATWTGYYILDGWAIQDDWVSQRPDGQRFHGTNIRSFNPESGHWDNRWLPQGTLRWSYFRSEQVDDTMVMIGGEGEDPRGAFVDRNVFYDFRPDSWKWRKDRSYDGGETWIEGIAHIEAQRRKDEGGPAKEKGARKKKNEANQPIEPGDDP